MMERMMALAAAATTIGLFAAAFALAILVETLACRLRRDRVPPGPEAETAVGFEEPGWWPEFERGFAHHVEAMRRHPSG
jgi:hypothetical protein